MNQEQSYTLVGVFDDYDTAQRAARELTNSGIPREAVQVQSNLRTEAAGSTASSDREHEGGISGFFHRLFGGHDDDDYAGHYSEAVRRGGAVVCVTAPKEQVDRTVEIMNANGAVDIDRRVASYRQEGYKGHDAGANPYTNEEAARERERFRNMKQESSIPVVEEELQVGKRAVQRGGVRVYSHVVERPVEENITLTEEHVRVERRPADRPLERGEASRLRDQTIEVTETAEEPVVQKRTRVLEEVVVGKETTQRTEKIRDKVRGTEVKVDNLGAQGGDEAYADDFRKDYQQNYASSGASSYETYEPAYAYGYRMANDPRYKGKNWNDVEQTLQTDYGKSYSGSKWDQMKGAVRYGWDKATRKG